MKLDIEQLKSEFEREVNTQNWFKISAITR